EALVAMERHPWPGNVRQLSNVIERAKILADGGLIRLADLPPEFAALPAHPAGDAERPGESPELLQRDRVMEALEKEGGNKARAARALGVSRRSLYRLLEKFETEDGLQGGKAAEAESSREPKAVEPPAEPRVS
ncbi:MAG: helix-turn-helix domain-containing protein, partial [Planctomycetia bacterium]|nr:helix-turn-helix domain-containing protein [Planctomycetia bacterium]